MWSEHVRNLRRKLLNRLGLLRRSKRLLSTYAMKSLYYAQIHSNINYALLLWGPMISNHNIKQLQDIQDKAVSCINTELSKEEMYLKYGILPISKMIQLELCKLGFKLINNLLPKPLTNALRTDHKDSSTTKSHPFETRNKCIPNLPTVKNNLYRNSFLFKAVSTLSKLPRDIRQQQNVQLFMRKCKVYLQRN